MGLCDGRCHFRSSYFCDRMPVWRISDVLRQRTEVAYGIFQAAHCRHPRPDRADRLRRGRARSSGGQVIAANSRKVVPVLGSGLFVAESRKIVIRMGGSHMENNKCIVSPDRDCPGLKRAEEVAADVKALNGRLSEFQQAVSETNSRFGGRIGKLEAHNDVQDEQVRQIKETQMEIKTEIREAQKEQKDSIADLRREHKESMSELKRSNQEILDAVTPMKHKVEGLEHLKSEVDEIKAKPGKTWESIKEKGLGWAVALMLALLAAALGLSKYL